jgi:glyoxylase-like metal-dependent hydrolase (beta-lactamase superfamily II)
MAIHVSSPADDVVALTDVKEIPGLGFLPVNAYVVQAEQPLLVDSGLPTSRPDFLEALWAQIEPADLRWIYLTHPDRDHTGSLMEILHAAPAARLITTFLGLGILSLEYHIDLERIFLLNPGQSLDLGDRRLTAFRPPVYDSPATTGFYDQRTGTCFTSDCFGSPVAFPDQACVDDISALSTGDLLAGQRLWASVDSPWVTSVDRTAFRASLQPLRELDPPVVLCTHLPPAHAVAAPCLTPSKLLQTWIRSWDPIRSRSRSCSPSLSRDSPNRHPVADLSEDKFAEDLDSLGLGHRSSLCRFGDQALTNAAGSAAWSAITWPTLSRSTATPVKFLRR